MENSAEHSETEVQWGEERITKPELEPITQPPNWGRTVFTMLLFVLMFKLIGVELLLILALLAVVTIHESGHFLAMKAFGYKNVSMFFVPLLGAFVSGEKRETPPGAEIIMLLAGPVPGILIGMGLLYFQTSVLLGNLGVMFLTVNLFNMLPFLPLDGGRIMDALFARERLFIRLILIGVSILVLLGFIFLSKMFMIGILGLGMVYSFISTTQEIKMRKQMDSEGLNYRQSYGQLSDEDYSKLRAFVIEEYEGLETEQEKAHQVASLLSRSSPRQLSLLEAAGYFLVWIFFLVVPILIINSVHGEEIRSAFLRAIGF